MNWAARARVIERKAGRHTQRNGRNPTEVMATQRGKAIEVTLMLMRYQERTEWLHHHLA